MGIVISVSFVTYRLVEKPARGLSRKLMIMKQNKVSTKKAIV